MAVVKRAPRYGRIHTAKLKQYKNSIKIHKPNVSKFNLKRIIVLKIAAILAKNPSENHLKTWKYE